MEKLQPVIRQIFWILFGLGLILILWAWSSASSKLSADIATETAKVEATKKGAQKNVMGLPNGEWTADAEKLNQEHDTAFDESATKLWEQQLDARVYPKRIRHHLKQLPFRSKIDHPGIRDLFAKLYNDYFDEQLAVINPFVHETGLGLVDVQSAQSGMVTRENPVKWKSKTPTSVEIWNAQEDIWLVRSILNAIAQTNGAADRIDKAPIRALLQLQLRGGDPEAKGGGAAGGDGLGGAEPGYGGGDYGGGFGGGGMGGPGGPMMGGGGMGDGMGAGMGAGGATGVWSTFEGSLSSDLLTEEFGPDLAAAAGGMMGGMMGGPGMGGAGMGPGYGGGEYGGGDGYGGGEETGGEEESDGTADRYVHYGSELPYKTRAFILKVKMIQKDIPTLLASLPNGKFPVEIVRVDIDFTGSASGGGMPGMGGGMGGGSGYGGGDYGGGGPGYGGGAGMMGPGMGGMGPGGMGGMAPGGLGGMGGFGGGTGNKPKTRRERKQASDGAGIFKDAMADARLATVRVAGLMTIYQTREENEAEAESEDAAKTEVNESSSGLPADLGDDDSGAETTDDTAGANAAGENEASAGNGASVGGDTGVQPNPAAGETPMDGAPANGAEAGAAPDSGQPQASTQRIPKNTVSAYVCDLLTA